MSLITKNDFTKQHINRKEFTILELEIALESVHILLEHIFVEAVVTEAVIDSIYFSKTVWFVREKSLVDHRYFV